MIRSMYSGISGLAAHQVKLDVVGNNIANVNTTGFKASDTQFQDTLSQVLQNSGAPTNDNGGTNPAQVGLGVQVAGITTNFQQGAAQLTNRTTDMMISGDGFFVVRKGNEQVYTRAGAFDFDSQGRLVTPDGGLVRGWAADASGRIDPNSPLADLQLPVSTLMGASPTTGTRFEGNLPSDVADGTVLNREIDVFAADGTSYPVQVAFTKTGNQWDISASLNGQNATGFVRFGPDGQQIASAPVTFPAQAAAGLEIIDVDLSALTGFAGLTTVEGVQQIGGRAAGTLDSFTINPDGTLMGSFSNGLKQPIGQIALATFANNAGLEKAGGSTYRTSVNSGEAQIGTAASGGRGSLSGGRLEMSNVDLSTEFTNLIVAQRGFQANGRVITTSDEVLNELVNLKR